MITNRKIPNSLLKILLVIFLLMPSLWLINDYRQNYSETKRKNKDNVLATSTAQASTPEDFSPSYPRLFNRYLRNSISEDQPAGFINALAKWDYLSLSPRVPATEIAQLKKLNPNIKIGREMTFTSVFHEAGNYPWLYDSILWNKVKAEGWLMRNAAGLEILTNSARTAPYHTDGINFTPYAKSDAQGKRFYDWWPEHALKYIVQPNKPDFLFIDEIYPGYSWLMNLQDNHDIDIDNDQVADSVAKIDAAAEEGVRLMLTNLRKVLDANGYKDVVIVGNGVNLGSLYPTILNGATRESFPFMHGKADPVPNPYWYNWKDNMFNQGYGYLATEGLMKNPHFSMILGYAPWTAGQDVINPPNDPVFIQKMRLYLASALLGDGYFGLADFYNLAWWFSDYFTFNGQEGYLGLPESSYSQIITESRQGSSYGVYQRKFTKGLVLVNASGYSQSVNIGDSYKKVPDGSAVSGTTTIPAWDALILVNPACDEGKVSNTCLCGGETLTAGQWCCSGQKKTVCNANADCSSGYTCSNPNTCQAQCLQVQQSPANTPVPAISKISPQTISLTGSTTAKITISGANFVKGATVKVNDIGATKVTFKSATAIEATIPLTKLKAGQASINVTNPDKGSVTLANALTLVSLPVITVSSPVNNAKVAAMTATITGKVSDPTASLIFKVGTGNRGSVTVNSSTGAFEKTVRLASGQNKITISAKNLAGTGTKTLTITNTLSLATITISSPTDKSKVAANTIAITGQVSDPTAALTVKVGSADQGSVTVNSSTGAFEKIVSLAVGKNTITLTATNVIGAKTKTLIVTNTLPANLVTIIPSSQDSDNDQLTDVEEALFTTDPKESDTDADSYLDGVEIKNRYSPKAGPNIKIKGTNLVKTYANSTYNYSVLYPSSFLAQATAADNKEVIFSAETGESISISVENNSKQLSALKWYLADSPGVDTSKIVETTIGGLKGINNYLNDTIYLASGTKVYVLSYNLGARTEANFRTTFTMISSSFSLKGKTSNLPIINQVSPSTISLVNLKKNATAKITITGANFITSATVKVNNVSASKVTVKNATVIEATIPLTKLKPGRATVTVINKDGGGGALAKAITLLGKKPSLSSVAPKTLTAKKSGVGFLTLKGKNFMVGAKVLLDGKTAVVKTEVLSASRLKITINLSLIRKGKTHNLMLINPDGQKATLDKAFKGK